MRRNNTRRGKTEGVDFKRVLYISGTVLAFAIIAFVITFFVYGNKLESEVQLSKLNTSIVDDYAQNIIEETSSQMGKTVNEMQEENLINELETTNTVEEKKVAVNTSIVENKIEEEKASSNATSNEANEKAETEGKEKETETVEEKEEEKTPNFIKPVEGEILREFAKNKLVYSNTLEEWITHSGIDIKADKTTVVKASAEGTVKSIKNDPRYGLTVVIEHTSGFRSVYSNLLTTEFVIVGEKVKQGQTIGTVGNTATFEIADEPHLHFEILKDNEALDPSLYIN